jgi:hypothetical protein
MQYKCFKADFEILQKKINHIGKKLDKHNLKYTFDILGESIEEIEVIDETNYNNVPSWQFHPQHKKIAVEVINYNFEMDSLKLGEYRAITVLEHGTVEGQTQNLIHVLDENIIIPEKYRTVKSICEHCNSDRQRNKTVLLQDRDGNIKQVGTTCIKEYTGIDAIDVIAAYQDIHDIIIDNNRLYTDYESISRFPRYIKTIDYLTACIELINKEGYSKDELHPTKSRAWEIALKNTQDSKYQEAAQTVIDYFKNSTFDESQNFLQNIKVSLSQEYAKQSGFIAYAFVAYNKQIEIDAKKKAEQEEKAKSEYVGNVGDKIQKELTLINKYTYETNYTYYGETHVIYVFADSDGNIYKWNTQNAIDSDINSNVKIKGSIKGHEEYNGQKQTVLTRCKIM